MIRTSARVVSSGRAVGHLGAAQRRIGARNGLSGGVSATGESVEAAR
ncbi:hypothetical protein [uncultured Chloroflexus sp.]|nr:hypothetical protein [uncultured Chloroflexus sp.]